jgi:hypothetical protein
MAIRMLQMAQPVDVRCHTAGDTATLLGSAGPLL